MSSLIERLDAAYKNNPDPDQIAAQINNEMTRWIQGKDFTSEILTTNYNKKCMIAIHRAIVGDSVIGWTLTWQLESLNQSLSEFWFILIEYYNPNDPLPY